MNDPATTVATLAVCIAILATVVAWIAFDTARLTRKWHNQLFKDFWKQSLEQAAENGKVWGYQLRQNEALREHFGIGATKPPEKPKTLN